jgi:hypothetical protein
VSNLEPWDQFAHLSFALEQVPDAHAIPAARALVEATHIVIRNLHGQRSRPEAFAALQRARSALASALNVPPTDAAKDSQP